MAAGHLKLERLSEQREDKGNKQKPLAEYAYEKLRV